MSKIEKAIRVMQQHKCEEISLYGDEYNLAIEAIQEKAEREKIHNSTTSFLYDLNLLPQHQEVIEKIEKALGFKLFVWQKTMIINGTSRRSGETTARIIRLLTENDQPLHLERYATRRSLAIWCTEVNNRSTVHWFKRELEEIKGKLEAGGVKCRKVLYTQEDCQETQRYNGLHANCIVYDELDYEQKESEQDAKM